MVVPGVDECRFIEKTSDTISGVEMLMLPSIFLVVHFLLMKFAVGREGGSRGVDGLDGGHGVSEGLDWGYWRD